MFLFSNRVIGKWIPVCWTIKYMYSRLEGSHATEWNDTAKQNDAAKQSDNWYFQCTVYFVGAYWHVLGLILLHCGFRRKRQSDFPEDGKFPLRTYRASREAKMQRMLCHRSRVFSLRFLSVILSSSKCERAQGSPGFLWFFLICL